MYVPFWTIRDLPLWRAVGDLASLSFSRFCFRTLFTFTLRVPSSTFACIAYCCFYFYFVQISDDDNDGDDDDGDLATDSFVLMSILSM